MFADYALAGGDGGGAATSAEAAALLRQVMRASYELIQSMPR
jgi:hypothetical protein